MKTKVSQKEWNDARDKFLCAIMNSAIINSGFIINKDAIEQAIKAANQLASELYEVEEIKETPMPQFIKEDWQRWNKLIRATPEQLREWFPQAYEGGENE
jgi:hypothetical protein